MTELLILTPLRVERWAVRRWTNGTTVAVTGMGPSRSRQAAIRHGLAGVATRPLVIAGFCGAVDHRLAPGDLVVASEVHGPDGRRYPLPSAVALVNELRRAGLRAVAGPLRSMERPVRGGERERIRTTGVVAVDMEASWLLGRVAPGGPVAVVRAVVDTPQHELRSLRTPSNTLAASRALRAAVPVLERWAEATRSRTVVLASPRSFCAGVERAIEVVERAIDRFGPPVYVRRQVIHNIHVVADLARRGAIFVQELDEVPDGARVVFAAHGVSVAVREDAARRGLATIDATCPLVAKVHAEVRRFTADGYQVILVGHADHEEVEGTMGEVPGAVTVIADGDEADEVEVADPAKVAYVTQTTLAVDEVDQVIERLRARFPSIEGPSRDDICYATQNRQDAARALADECDVVLVVGSRNSSNSNRLVEVVRRAGCAAHLLDDATGLELAWVAGAERIGITAGASAPESMVQEVVDALRGLGPVALEERQIRVEDVHFALPSEVR